MASSKLDLAKQHYATSSLVVGYALCSSLLAVINKYAITKFNYPGLLTALQYLTSALGVWVLGKLGFLYHDAFTWETAKKFLPAATVFYLAIFTNTNLLRHANVDTFIVFRSLTPLLVAIADTAFRRQPCPSKFTYFSLVTILGGAVGYVMTDSAFTIKAYSWALAYLVTITTEMVYIKHMVTNLGLNTWGFVFYNNLLSLLLAPVFWIATGEYAQVFSALEASAGNWFDSSAFWAVALSCLFGLLISFFGFAARKAISATAFTVTGVVNKFLTVAINVLIWDKHASPFGLVCLIFTIVGGILYQQSVTKGGGPLPSLRETSVVKQNTEEVKDNDDFEEKDVLIDWEMFHLPLLTDWMKNKRKMEIGKLRVSENTGHCGHLHPSCLHDYLNLNHGGSQSNHILSDGTFMERKHCRVFSRLLEGNQRVISKVRASSIKWLSLASFCFILIKLAIGMLFVV